MRPPMCFVCLRSLKDGEPSSSFEAVQFAVSPEEEAWQRERDREGWVGHPSEVEWFCDEHTAQARDLSHLHWREALERLAQQRRSPGGES